MLKWATGVLGIDDEGESAKRRAERRLADVESSPSSSENPTPRTCPCTNSASSSPLWSPRPPHPSPRSDGGSSDGSFRRSNASAPSRNPGKQKLAVALAMPADAPQRPLVGAGVGLEPRAASHRAAPAAPSGAGASGAGPSSLNPMHAHRQGGGGGATSVVSSRINAVSQPHIAGAPVTEYLTLTLRIREGEETAGFGLMLTRLSRVAAIDQGSPAEVGGLELLDKIIEVDGEPSDADVIGSHCAGKATIELTVERPPAETLHVIAHEEEVSDLSAWFEAVVACATGDLDELDACLRELEDWGIEATERRLSGRECASVRAYAGLHLDPGLSLAEVAARAGHASVAHELMSLEDEAIMPSQPSSSPPSAAAGSPLASRHAAAGSRDHALMRAPHSRAAEPSPSKSRRDTAAGGGAREQPSSRDASASFAGRSRDSSASCRPHPVTRERLAQSRDHALVQASACRDPSRDIAPRSDGYGHVPPSRSHRSDLPSHYASPSRAGLRPRSTPGSFTKRQPGSAVRHGHGYPRGARLEPSSQSRSGTDDSSVCSSENESELSEETRGGLKALALAVAADSIAVSNASPLKSPTLQPCWRNSSGSERSSGASPRNSGADAGPNPAPNTGANPWRAGGWGGGGDASARGGGGAHPSGLQPSSSNPSLGARSSLGATQDDWDEGEDYHPSRARWPGLGGADGSSAGAAAPPPQQLRAPPRDRAAAPPPLSLPKAAPAAQPRAGGASSGPQGSSCMRAARPQPKPEGAAEPKAEPNVVPLAQVDGRAGPSSFIDGRSTGRGALRWAMRRSSGVTRATALSNPGELRPNRARAADADAPPAAPAGGRVVVQTL